MGQVLRTSQAHIDLVEIATYLYTIDPVATERVLEVIEEKCQHLSDFPEMGRKREEIASRLRSFPAGNYVIFYRPKSDGIEVIRVLHGARDLPRLLGESF